MAAGIVFWGFFTVACLLTISFESSYLMIRNLTLDRLDHCFHSCPTVAFISMLWMSMLPCEFLQNVFSNHHRTELLILAVCDWCINNRIGFIFCYQVFFTDTTEVCNSECMQNLISSRFKLEIYVSTATIRSIAEKCR